MAGTREVFPTRHLGPLRLVPVPGSSAWLIKLHRRFGVTTFKLTMIGRWTGVHQSFLGTTPQRSDCFLPPFHDRQLCSPSSSTSWIHSTQRIQQTFQQIPQRTLQPKRQASCFVGNYSKRSKQNKPWIWVSYCQKVRLLLRVCRVAMATDLCVSPNGTLINILYIYCLLYTSRCV